MDEERLAKIEQEKQNALNQSNNIYNELLKDNQNIFNQQNEYANSYEKIQNETLDKQLAFQQQQIEQQKENAQKNMEIESQKAKNDYAAYVNPYGIQAESFANQGLLNSGVSETAKLGSFNTYQNRLATANKAMQEAFTQYDKDINEARLNNDVQKAQNALTKLQLQLEYSNNFYNNKSTITQNQLSNNQNIDSDYYNRYQTEYNNIQAEKQRQEAIRQWEAELAEQQRQYNETLAYQKAQAAQEQANWEKEYALAKSSSSKSNNSYTLTNGGSSSVITDSSTQMINTPYYQGTINPDTQYGTFETTDSNGIKYQPDNVGGKKLSNSKLKMKDVYSSAQGSTGVDLSNQTIWTTGDKYYYWDGSLNNYIDITRDIPKISSNNKSKNTNTFINNFMRNLTSKAPFSLFK